MFLSFLTEAWIKDNMDNFKKEGEMIENVISDIIADGIKKSTEDKKEKEGGK